MPPRVPLSPRLPLLLALADAAHDGETVLLSVGGLGSALGIGLALQFKCNKRYSERQKQKKGEANTPERGKKLNRENKRENRQREDGMIL